MRMAQEKEKQGGRQGEREEGEKREKREREGRKEGRDGGTEAVLEVHALTVPIAERLAFLTLVFSPENT